MRFIFIMLFSFSLLSCGKSQEEKGCSSHEEDVSGVGCVDLDAPLSPSHKNLVSDPSSGIPTLALTFETNLSLVNFDYDETEKVLAAAELIRRVVATPEFRDEILNYTFEGQLAFKDNQGFTNEEIYQIILEGAERLRPARNNSLDVTLQLYHEETNIIGYTYVSSEYIWLNRKYFSYYTPAQVSGNLFHEWLHKLGFMHSYEWTPDRKDSVPYAIGYIMGRLANQLMQ